MVLWQTKPSLGSGLVRIHQPMVCWCMSLPPATATSAVATACCGSHGAPKMGDWLPIYGKEKKNMRFSTHLWREWGVVTPPL